MKRMTTIPQAELIKCTNCSSYDVCFGDECGVISYAIEVLKQYEDTGLTPEQIRELVERDTEKKILPITYKPLLEAGWRYECPNCGCAVGENIYHPDVTKDYEYCSMCGQKLEG